MSKPRAQQWTLEKVTQGKVSYFWLHDSLPNRGKFKTLSRVRGLKMPTWVYNWLEELQDTTYNPSTKGEMNVYQPCATNEEALQKLEDNFSINLDG